MQKAWELSPAIFPSSEQFTEWSDRFHGLHGAFTCTSVVADSMQPSCQKIFPECSVIHPATGLGLVQPQPAWN
ncbi:restriction endonuclease Eco57I [Salmonella enterica subsp. enterica]|nr:restriction endonuclease Eco57I [Salmonella enterica subsp. enterica] [Salmonella enterica subsp. enterica serovar Menston]